VCVRFVHQNLAPQGRLTHYLLTPRGLYGHARACVKLNAPHQQPWRFAAVRYVCPSERLDSCFGIDRPLAARAQYRSSTASWAQEGGSTRVRSAGPTREVGAVPHRHRLRRRAGSSRLRTSPPPSPTSPELRGPALAAAAAPNPHLCPHFGRPSLPLLCAAVLAVQLP
jgi:hypothetical protein